jgi:hypothetical protein
MTFTLRRPEQSFPLAWFVLAGMVIVFPRPLTAQRPNTPDATLVEAFAAWKQARSHTKRVHLRTRGTVTIRQGMEVIQQPEGKQIDFPSRDIEYESEDEYFIDFEHGKYRHDRRSFALHNPSEKLTPIKRIDVLDAVERKIYSANPEKGVGRLAPDVSLKATKVQDSDVIQIGLEPTMYCFGYLSQAEDDRRGWNRDPRLQDFTVVATSPLRLRKSIGSRARRLYVESTFLDQFSYRLAAMRWVGNGLTMWELKVEYDLETKLPKFWQLTTNGAGRELMSQIDRVEECTVNGEFPPNVFELEVRGGMALKNDDGFFRVQGDGKSLMPITPREVARGFKDD